MLLIIIFYTVIINKVPGKGLFKLTDVAVNYPIDTVEKLVYSQIVSP